MAKVLRWLQSIMIGLLIASVGIRAQDATVSAPTEPAPVAVAAEAQPAQAPAESSQPAAQQPEPVTPTPTQDTVTQPEAVPAPQSQESAPTPATPEISAATPPTQEEIASQTQSATEQPKTAEQIVDQAKVVPPPTLGTDEIRGIDTVDLKEEDAQGNWLYKRVWWERAEAKYEKIRAAVNKIFEMRTSFFAKRAELDKTILDPFYIKIGLGQGELQEIIAELIAKTSKETKDSRVADVLEQAEDEKSELEQLKKEVDLVVKQDKEVEDAILMLVEQLNKIRRLEQEAWQNFKNIARVLDDKKARELFYKVDNAWRNIQEMQNYIEKTYSGSFDLLVERIKEKITKIDSAILALKERGFDLKKQVATDEQEQEEEKEQAPKGFFTRYIIDPIKNFFKAIWSVIRWPIDKIMGKKAVQEEIEEEVDVQETETQDEGEPAEQEKVVPASATMPAESDESAMMMPREESQEDSAVPEITQTSSDEAAINEYAEEPQQQSGTMPEESSQEPIQAERAIDIEE